MLLICKLLILIYINIFDHKLIYISKLIFRINNLNYENIIIII